MRARAEAAPGPDVAGEQSELPGDPEQPQPFERIAALAGGARTFQSLAVILVPLHGDSPSGPPQTNAGRRGRFPELPGSCGLA